MHGVSWQIGEDKKELDGIDVFQCACGEEIINIPAMPEMFQSVLVIFAFLSPYFYWFSTSMEFSHGFISGLLVEWSR